jgi:hypothetical protein
MGGDVTEEKTINHDQYLDLAYSQSNTLYDLIPHAPLPSNDPLRLISESHFNGMVGSLKLQSATQSTRKQGHPTYTPASSQTGTNTKYEPSPAQTF